MNSLSTIPLLLLIALSGPAKAQLLWYKGELTLVTSIRLTGEVCYQPKANAVLFRMAGKWRVYQAHELEWFQYIDMTTIHRFAPYEILGKNGETQSVLFEELTVAGAEVRLLELPARYGTRQTLQLALPYPNKEAWKTQKHWFVWFNGQLVALDTFVETEIDGLVARAPNAAQHWDRHFPRPANPKALARWLTLFYRQVVRSQSQKSPNVVAKMRLILSGDNCVLDQQH